MTDQCVAEVTSGLENYGWSPLWVHRGQDLLVHEIELKVCTATVSTPENHVFNAWVIVGGGMMNCVNADSFPRLMDAVAYHLGKLLTEGPYRIVSAFDGPEKH